MPQLRSVIPSEAKDPCTPARHHEPIGAPRFAIFETWDTTKGRDLKFLPTTDD